MNNINDFLSLKIIVDKKLFVITNFQVKYMTSYLYSEAQFKNEFDTLCKNIFLLMTRERIPIDVKIRFINLNSKENALNFFKK